MMVLINDHIHRCITYTEQDSTGHHRTTACTHSIHSAEKQRWHGPSALWCLPSLVLFLSVSDPVESPCTTDVLNNIPEGST